MWRQPLNRGIVFLRFVDVDFRGHNPILNREHSLMLPSQRAGPLKSSDGLSSFTHQWGPSVAMVQLMHFYIAREWNDWWHTLQLPTWAKSLKWLSLSYCKFLINMLHTMGKQKLNCNIGFPLPFALIAELLAMIPTAPKLILIFAVHCNAVHEPRRFNIFCQPTSVWKALKLFLQWSGSWSSLSHTSLPGCHKPPHSLWRIHTLQGCAANQRETFLLSTGGCTWTHLQIVPAVLTRGRKHRSQTLHSPV